MTITGTIIGLAALQAALDGVADEATRRADQAMDQALIYGQALVKANASGRPGPNIITGDYVRSIEYRKQNHPTGVDGWIGTNRPQGRRLEFGFAGADVLGRVFNQPPRPHFGPAAEQLRVVFPDLVHQGLAR